MSAKCYCLVLLTALLLPSFSTGEQNAAAALPKYGAALRMVEKELIKLQEHSLDVSAKQDYFYWLVLEYYILHGGLSQGGSKQIEGYERLRGESRQRREKAYFDCQMWLALDRELKVEPNEALWNLISKLARVESHWLALSRARVEEKGVFCFSKIGPGGEWMGDIYRDEQYDFRVKRMLKSARTLTPFVKPSTP